MKTLSISKILFLLLAFAYRRSHASTFGESCNQESDCQSDILLTCQNGTCGCATGRIYNEALAQCMIKAGQPCTFEDNQCITDSTCSDNYCLCLNDYYQSDDGACQPKKNLGSPCLTNSQCKTHFTTKSNNGSSIIISRSLAVCQEGICSCEASSTQYLSENGETVCGRKFGYRCQQNDCMGGAKCLKGYCNCNQLEYVDYKTQSCKPKQSINDSCTADHHCLRGLYCGQRPSICTCRGAVINFNEVYDTLKRACVVQVGFPCRGNFDCSANAECFDNRTSPSLYSKTCRCTPNAQPIEGYCYIRQGEKCTSDEYSETKTGQVCLPGMICQNRRCNCPDFNHQVYVEEELRCKSLIGGPCAGTEDCLDTNAECKNDTIDRFSTCRCKANFVSAERQCDLPYGGKCSRDDDNLPLCDRQGPLECNTENICKCPQLHVYDNSTATCRGLAGAKCELGKEGFCVEGAFCKFFRAVSANTGVCTCNYEDNWRPEEDRTCKRGSNSKAFFKKA